MRLVAQPSREVKALQRSLLAHLERVLPVHKAASAYSAGSSILHNAKLHVNSNYLLKMDFEEFFPSIGAEALSAHLLKYADNRFTEVEVQFILDLVLWRPPESICRGLCIGAPSSPFLSNTTMVDIDDAIDRRCVERGALYSRYSDDISISAEDRDVLAPLEHEVREIVWGALYPKLRFNEDKRVAIARNTAMTVTGLTLANQGFVTVGRSRKRGVRAGICRFIHEQLGDDEINRLKGELAFVLSVEPSFRAVLLRSYGNACEALLPKVREGGSHD